MSLPVNLFSRVRGAASLHYKGQDFWTKDVMMLDADFKPFTVDSDAFGPLDSRFGMRLLTVKFTPVGVWTAAQLAVLYPYLNPRYGDFNTPVRAVTAVDTVHSNLTSAAHGQITGTGVRVGVGPGGVLPTGIAANTTYYLWANPDGNTIQLYDTEAHALAADGADLVVGQVAITSAGTAPIFFIVNSPLIITTQDGVQLTLWNAAIVDMPDGSFGPAASVLKTVTFEAYTLHGQLWSDANSLYTFGAGVITAQPPNQGQIPTVPYTIDWETREVVTAVNNGTGALTVPNHGFSTGAAVTMDDLNPGAALPNPLVAGTTYYVIEVDGNNIKLATSSGNATAGASIALTSAGAGDINVVSIIQATAISPREAVEVSHKVTWNDITSQGDTLNCRQIKLVKSTVSFVPTNLALQTILNALAFQGGTAAPGQSMPTANLDIYGPAENPFIRIYGAQLQNLPARFGMEADRLDKLTFAGNQRVFRGGAPSPIAYVGTQAPAA
jgi:hypothetical protein